MAMQIKSMVWSKSDTFKAISFFIFALIILTFGTLWCILFVYSLKNGKISINSNPVLILTAVLIAAIIIIKLYASIINFIVEMLFPKLNEKRFLKLLTTTRKVPQLEWFFNYGKTIEFQFSEGTFHMSTLITIPSTSILLFEELDKINIKKNNDHLSVIDKKGNQREYSGDIAMDLLFLLWLNKSPRLKEYFKDKWTQNSSLSKF